MKKILILILGTFFAVPLIQDNVQKWGQARGWDKLLLDAIPGSLLAFLGQNIWLLFGSGFVVGAALSVLGAGAWVRARDKRKVAAGAHVQLLLRPGAEPFEITKSNVFRWFVYKTMFRDQAGNASVLSTQVFLIFEVPTDVSYRRVTCSVPGSQPSIIELTGRSMVFSIEGSIDGSTIEAQVSAQPI